MDATMTASLAVLALIDSTSFGTLLIPIWLLLHPGPVRSGRILIFLGTVGTFYFALGLIVTLGAGALLPQISAMLATRPVQWTQLVLGVALFFWSFVMGRNRKPSGAGRMHRWRERALNDEGGALPLAGLALTAAAVEVGSMLPYIAAIGLITTAALPLATITVTLAGYCLLMITPALVLLAARLTAGKRLDPVLTRVGNWMSNSETIAWIVGIVGFLLARDAAAKLMLIGS
ncbi:GAP family protein [Actinoplanes xinjiangensis]|uniref:Sap-like sulfolipid-1-addressing protein n=1 Tax=Actinoplanes xinjiangensis TaxID=512350 RepID=A0A316F9J7_9ACTN|nr:GAP family protein [Actinoplanes xinjiangensis]PWK44392.1 Sap-like sulfolipid-1-addressing protein [Actinoplanes xinjiangensis]